MADASEITIDIPRDSQSKYQPAVGSPIRINQFVYQTNHLISVRACFFPGWQSLRKVCRSLTRSH